MFNLHPFNLRVLHKFATRVVRRLGNFNVQLSGIYRSGRLAARTKGESSLTGAVTTKQHTQFDWCSNYQTAHTI